LILAVCTAFPQTPAKFITMDVVAVGTHGQPVPGLQASEIQLLDNKKVQPVLYWHWNQRRPDVPRVTLVVLDGGIKGARWIEAVRAMRQFETSEQLYFYAVTGTGALLPVHALPNPDAALPAANGPWMDRYLPAFEAAWRVDRAGRRTGMIDVSPYMEFATRLAAFPGRKNLICFGCLFARSAQWDQNADAAEVVRATELRHLADAFRLARVAVYVAGGARANSLVDDNTGPVPLDEIGALAEATGGRAYGTGEIAEVITQAIADGRSNYRIAYLPPAENWDGKRHKISVVSTRKGVRLLAPAWYEAGRLDDIATEWRPAIPDYAITSPYEQSAIGISVSAPKQVAGGLRVEVHADAADVLLFPRNGRYSGSLIMQALCYTPEGRRMACSDPVRIKLDLSEQERAEALRGGLRFPLEVPASDASSKIRVVVHDEISGDCGSVTFLPRAEQ